MKCQKIIGRAYKEMSFGVVYEFIDDNWNMNMERKSKWTKSSNGNHLMSVIFLFGHRFNPIWTNCGRGACPGQPTQSRLEKQIWYWQRQAMERMTFTKVVLVFFAMLICPPIWIFFSLPLDIRLNSRDQNDNFPDITLKLLCSFLPGQIKSHSSSLFAAASATCTFCSCWS